jgi:hypothetical protein
MRFEPRIFHCQKGLAAIVTSVLLMILLFSVLTLIIVVFNNYSSSSQQQLSNDAQRSLEQIAITNYGIENNVLHVTILNTGRIDVNIKALYKLSGSEVTYYCDPSTLTPDTHIAVDRSLTLLFPSNALPLNPSEKIVAATERGVKSNDVYVPKPLPTPMSTYDASKYIYGKIELEWTTFKYKTWQSGNFDPNGGWLPGWTISNAQKNIAFQVKVKNIDETRNIIIDSDSSITLDPIGIGSGSNPSRTSWFLYSSPTTLTRDQEVTITFVYSTPDTGYQGIYNQDTVCAVFLALFGKYSTDDPYGQTIPFEASITIK